MGRGKPKGSRNKKHRGRPLGSKNRVIKITIKHTKKIRIRCVKCKRHYTIRTNNPELYTPEVKKNWTCPICKRY